MLPPVTAPAIASPPKQDPRASLKQGERDVLFWNAIREMKKQLVVTHGRRLMTKVNVPKNKLCPCGSGLKFKRCHYNQLRQAMGPT